jgi:hypothetical protein
MGFIDLQIEWNPWLGGYRPQIPILSVLYPQLNLLNPPPKKIPGYATVLDRGNEYCLSLLVQEIMSQRSETWNDNINIQWHDKSLTNAKLCDV